MNGFGLFALLTFIYSMLNYNQRKGLVDNPANTSKKYFIGYILLVFITQLYANISLASSKCGANQGAIPFIATIIPWLFMFGSLTMILAIFPGWISPFSNTFGYFAALISGVNNLINDIFLPYSKSKVPEKNQDNPAQMALAHIYGKKSLMINEITPSNFNYFWSSMKSLFRSGVENNKQLKESLYNVIVLKDVVAEFMWYILGGLLVSSISYNYIITSDCNISQKEMQKRHDEYEKDMREEAKSEKDKNKRVYSSTE
jgi:hypothetical protein